VCRQKKINIFMSTHNFRRYIDLLNEADPVPPNTEVALPSLGTFNNDQAIAAASAQENRCVKCGTPQAQHTGLKHAFAAEPGATGGGGIARIKQLQQELKAAGAPLGATGAARDGIDGALGPLTRAAAAKNPIIAAKYSDVLGTETATPASQATISQLTTALDTIEQILAKYKVKMSESRSVGNTDQMATWRNLMEAVPTAQQRQAYQGAIQRNIPADTETPGFAQSKIQKGGYVPPAPANPYVTRPGGSREAQAYQAQRAAQTASTAATAPAQAIPYSQAAGKVAGKGLLKTAAKALPLAGLAIGAADAGNRYQKGDYTGAGIAGAAGLVSLIPGIGWVAGLGLDAYNLYRDATNDPKINISPEDAAVLDQNLKTLQNLSRDPAVAAAITPEIRARLERVIKAAATVIVADTPADGTQSATPAGSTSTPDDLVKSVDGIEKILTKYKFEDVELATNINIMTEHELRSFVLKNMHLLSESEQMAVRRDMMTEGPMAWAAKKLAPKFKAGWDAAQADAAKAAAQTVAAAKAATPTGTIAGSAGSAAKKVWDGTKWVTKKATQAALAYGAYTAYQLYDMLKGASDSADDLMSDDNSYLSDADKAELGQHATVLEKYLKTPEDAAKLPLEIQQRLAAINTRMKNLVAAGADR
jgi:hypothetical protein